MPHLPPARPHSRVTATWAGLARAPLALVALVALAACGGDSSGPAARVATIAFSSAIDAIAVGETRKLQIELTYTDGKPIKANPKWGSSNPSVATVDSIGNVTGVSIGSTVISVTAGGQSDQLPLNVVSSSTPGLIAAPPLPTSLGDGSYSVRLEYVGTPDSRAESVANSAIAKWRSVINGDLTDVQVDIPENACYQGQPAAAGTTIDDMLIYVRIIDIDGAGKVLARAGPCYIRQSNGIPVIGVIEFDLADLDRPTETVQAVFTHEIGHVLGIGPRWSSRSLIFDASGDDPLFIGQEANKAYVALGASSNMRVPIENTGGTGTRGSHWRESRFANELMTGFINAGANPMSTVTVASLRDLGYRVNMGNADSYALSSSSNAVAGEAGEAGAGSAGFRINEELLQPRWIVDDIATGRARRIVTHER